MSHQPDNYYPLPPQTKLHLTINGLISCGEKTREASIATNETRFPILDLTVETPSYVKANLETLVANHGGVRIAKEGRVRFSITKGDLREHGVDWAYENFNVLLDPNIPDESEPFVGKPIEEYYAEVFGERWWEHPELAGLIRPDAVPTDT